MPDPLRIAARVLHAVADRLDPPRPEEPRMPVPRGVYYVDLTTGASWLDGKIVAQNTWGIGHG